MTTTVHYYSGDARTIVRTRSYETRARATRAIQRAAKRGQIAAFASTRKASDQPTCHH